MTNWITLSGAGQRITTWTHDAQRGWLSAKDYPDPTTGNPGAIGPDYTYKLSGRLWTRTWARGNPRIQTTYAYNNAGDLETVTFNDGTPSITYTYDRRGRPATVARNGITTTLKYNDPSLPIGESYSGGTLTGLYVTNIYDNYLRRTQSASKTSGGATLSNVNYSYDSDCRLQSVGDGTYSYLANSPLVSQIVLKQNTTVRMTATKQLDYLHPVRYRVTVDGAPRIRSPCSYAGSLMALTVSHGVNRLTSITSTPTGGGASTVSFAYLYNAANLRTRATLTDGSYWVYDYDDLGQVRSGKKYWSEGTAVACQQFEYTQDDIGNRTQTKAGGEQRGAERRYPGDANRLFLKSDLGF